MRAGLNDLILQKQVEIQERAIKQIRETLHGEKPFAMVKVDNKIVIDAVNGLGDMDMEALVDEFGTDRINQLIWEVKRMENRRTQNGNAE